MVVDVERAALRRPAPLRRAHLPPRRRGQERRLRDRSSTRSCRSRCITDAKRLQQILKNLLSNAFKFTHAGQVTLAIEPATSRLEPATTTSLNRAAEVHRVLGDRHRHRHPAGQAADHLRGLPAGRRQHQPQVRRHRPRPRDQPRALAPARRRDPPRQRAAARAARSRSTCRIVYTALSRPSRSGAAGSAGVAPAPGAARRPRPTRSTFARAPTAMATSARPPAPTHRRCRTRTSFRPSRSSPPTWGTTATSVQPGDDVLLIVENDLAFARLLLETAREAGFKGLVTTQGAAALALAREFRASARSRSTSSCPTSTAGACSTRLKNDLATRHIPVVRHLDRRRTRAGAALGRPLRSSPSRSRARTCSTTLLSDVQALHRPPPRSACWWSRRLRRGAKSWPGFSRPTTSGS